MNEVKDVYHPVSDMDIQKELVRTKGKVRKSRVKKDVKSSSMSLRTKLTLVTSIGIVAISAITWTGIFAMRKTNEFFDNYYLQNHNVVEMKFSWPMTVEKREVLTAYVPVTPAGQVLAVAHKNLSQPEKIAVVKKANFSKLIAGIWTLETTRGKGKNDNDPTNHQSNCEKVGGSNEFGYDPQHNTCFGSFEESVAFLDKYIEEHLNDLSLNQTLCLYNTGKATDTCQYAQDYHALDKSGDIALR